MKRIHLLIDDGMYDKKAFYEVKNYFYVFQKESKQTRKNKKRMIPYHNDLLL